MKIDALPTGPFEEICYLVSNQAGQTIVFDPGFDGAELIHFIEEHGLNVVGYVCTHAHADHINALAELHKHSPAPIAIHPKDQAWAYSALNQINPYYPIPNEPEGAEYHALDESKTWKFGDIEFQCIETPGHTPGSCCILFPEAQILISGDTLFKGSCGRTDLPNGNARHLKESLNKLKELPESVQVYPGHGESTTIGFERATNFFMQ